MAVYQVKLQPKALATIEEELAFTGWDSQPSTVETGGWLFTPQGAGWWGGIDVQEASGPGPGAEKGYDGLTLDHPYMRDLDELFRRDGLELAGGWHTHPSGQDQPSSVDLDPASTPPSRIAYVLDHRAALKCRTQRALEIIFTPRPHGEGWEAWPWVFYRGTSRILGTEGIQPEGAVLHLLKGD